VRSLESDAPLAVFSAVQVRPPDRSGPDGADTVDGKVVALPERNGSRTALVQFIGVGWNTRERISALARAAGQPQAANAKRAR
jgi:hypothetical protein